MHINFNVYKQKIAKNNKEIHEMQQMVQIKKRYIERKTLEIQ